MGKIRRARLNVINTEVEKVWTKEARWRLDEHERGQVKSIPGQEVFGTIRERLSES